MKKPKQVSWRTLMRKASKAATPAEAKRLRDMAAARRRVERADKKPKQAKSVKALPSFKTKVLAGRLPTDQEFLDYKASTSGGDKLTISRWDNAQVVELKKMAQRLEGELRNAGGNSRAPQLEADLETQQLIVGSLENELVYRDQQLIDEFISGITNLRRFGPQPGCDPNYYLVPNSAIDAILKVLTRK